MVDILTTLHESRELLKIDYHDRRGKKRVGVSYDIKTTMLTIKGNGSTHINMPLSDFLKDEDFQQQVRVLCIKANVNYDFIMENLLIFKDGN